MSRHKAQGPDGIGAAFYHHFGDELAEALVQVFNDVRRRRLLPPSMRQYNVVLIPKKIPHTATTRSVNDYRPISLLRSDYKVLAKVLASRLDSILWKVVGQHQIYGIRKRSIQRNLHIMRSVCEREEAGGWRTAVLQVDLKEAFDRV